MKLNTILDQIDLGSIALPEFQRGYVWSRDQVRKLMRSLYLGYPVGSLLVWKTKTENVQARGDGDLASGTVDLLLDGQQRITSLYGIVRGKPPEFFDGNEKAFLQLYFNLETQEFEFYGPVKMQDNPRWINVTELMQVGAGQFAGMLYDSEALRPNAGTYLGRINAIDSIKTREFHIETVSGEQTTLDMVVDIFNEVNSGGTKLSKGDLALAKVCASWPEARTALKDRLGKWETAGYNFKLDWLMRCVTTTLTGEALFTALEDVDTPTFQDGLLQAEKHVDLILDLLASRLGLDHDRVLGSRSAIPLMTYYLEQKGGRFDDFQERDRLLYWYIHTLLWGRYSGSTESILSRDLNAVKNANGDPLDALIQQLRQNRGDLRIHAQDFDSWSKGSRFYPMLYMLTRVWHAKDWQDGRELSAHLLGKNSNLQIHHIFPKSLLYDLNFERRDVNAIANFTFLTQDTNLWISNKDPQDYFVEVETKNPGLLETHWIPMDEQLWLLENYLDFTAARRELLAEAANDFLDSLVGGSVPDVAEVPSVLERETPIKVVLGGIDSEEEAQLLEDCNNWVVRQGLAEGELSYELVDDGTKQPLAIFDLAWPRGLQLEKSEPVALLLDEETEIVNIAQREGYLCFTDVYTFKEYVEDKIIGEPEAIEAQTVSTDDNLYDALVRIARSRDRITYQEIAPVVGLNLDKAADRDKLSNLLGDISQNEVAEGRPMLSVVVINAASNQPGKGFFRLAKELDLYSGKTALDQLDFFVKELTRTYDYWAKSKPPPPTLKDKKLQETQSEPEETEEVTEDISGEEPVDDEPILRKVYPGAGSEDTSSQAEIELLELFDELPDEFTVIHSAKWITHDTRQHGTIGEADFVVAHPQHGVLILEVKGGEISVERNKWFSTDRYRTKHRLKMDPFDQAERSRFALLTWLQNDKRTKNLDFAIFSGVVFPDCVMDHHLRPDAVKDVVIDAHGVNNLEQSLLDLYAYWRRKYEGAKMSGKAAVNGLINLLVPTNTLKQHTAAVFERERKKIDKLTAQQFRVLRNLQMHRKASIVGGAGTGKTMLAIEKANQLLQSGFRVLFLCFNANLAQWLNQQFIHDNIHVSTYHSLVSSVRQWAGLPNLRLSMDQFNEQAPDLLYDAIQIIRTPNAGLDENLFDAIIVDEGQDFRSEWWIPLTELLYDESDGIFYVFFDNNQRIYTQISDIPVQTPPFRLGENCRNTKHIHEQLLNYSYPEDNTICIGPPGSPVEIIPKTDESSSRRELQRLLHRLVNEQGVSPQDIVILTTLSKKRSQWQQNDQLGNFNLTWDLMAKDGNNIRISTIHSFKGLESPVVILTELDRRRGNNEKELLYVALSRARNHLISLGELPEIDQ